MSTQKTVMATLAGAVALFALGFLIYVVLLPNPEFTQGPGFADCFKTEVNFPAIILMEVLWALLLAIVFGRWAGIKTFNTGLKAGAVFGILIGICLGLDLFATTTLLTANAIIFYGLTYMVRYAVAGGVVGWVLGRE